MPPIEEAERTALGALEGELNLTWDDIRRVTNQIAIEKGEWGGVPLPIDGIRLVVEPRYPFPKLNGFKLSDEDDDARLEAAINDLSADELVTKVKELVEVIRQEKPIVRNSWFSFSRNQRVVIEQRADGKIRHYCYPDNFWGDRYLAYMGTMQAALAWDPDAEEQANRKLQELVTPHVFRLYRMTGTFMESSKRSKLVYVFRKLRPLLVLRNSKRGDVVPLVALCMHPIGYYEGTFAGCMVPTDDIIAQLLLMRGDEHRLWKKANQIPLWQSNSGI